MLRSKLLAKVVSEVSEVSETQQQQGSSVGHPRTLTDTPLGPLFLEPSTDAGFTSDTFRTLDDIQMPERPKPRAAPSKARTTKLTQDVVDELPTTQLKYYLWDLKHVGLGVRVGASGSKAFVVKINLSGKRSKWLTLKAETLEAAGIEYHDTLANYGKGKELPKRQTEQLWQDVVDRFSAEHLGTVKPSSQATYKSALKLVREAFKDRPVRSIVYGDVWAFHAGLSDRSRQANVCVRLCGAIFDRCIAWDVWDPREQGLTPTERLQKSNWKAYPEPARDRRLTDDELASIGEALRAMEGTESQFPIAAVRLLLLTGKRLREILDLRWDQIDLEARTIRWTKTKTGAMEAPLNDAALEVLQGLDRMTFKGKDGKEVEHPYVLPGAEEGKPIQDLNKFWQRLTKKAGIKDLHRHDLRHAHGNEAAGLGLNLQKVAALLGHRDAHTSERYSKVDAGQHPAMEASQAVSGSLSRKLGGK